jgi:hypothetical protein
MISVDSDFDPDRFAKATDDYTPVELTGRLSPAIISVFDWNFCVSEGFGAERLHRSNLHGSVFGSQGTS